MDSDVFQKLNETARSRKVDIDERNALVETRFVQETHVFGFHDGLVQRITWFEVTIDSDVGDVCFDSVKSGCPGDADAMVAICDKIDVADAENLDWGRPFQAFHRRLDACPSIHH